MAPTNPMRRPAEERIVKRRASTACYTCRARKIKCSVVKTGIPCYNCRRGHVECAVSYARKKRKPDTERSATSPSSVALNDVEKEGANLSRNMAARLDEFLATAPVSLDFKLSNHVPELPYQTPGDALAEDEAPQASPATKDTPRPLDSSSTILVPQSNASTSPQTQTQADVRLPNFIHPLQVDISGDDVEYLTKNGAFTVPEPLLRNELLRNYVQYVHPFLPLLDLHDLLQPIGHHDGSSQISLILFQAVMFAATSFVDMRFLTAQGFENRKDARKYFFKKAKLLFDFDYELDPITLVQSLLLMNYWYEKPDDRKGPWYWMTTALGFAYNTGLHRSFELLGMDPKKQKLRRRLWWCCFMRAKLIALSMRKDTGIKDKEYDILMLTRDDFDTQPLSSQVLSMLGDCSAASDPGQMSLLTELCIEQAKLCLCISHVLDSHYSLCGHRISATAEPTMMLFPKKSLAGISALINCEQELDQWHGNSRARMPGFNEHNPAYGSDILQIHRGILEMIYLTASSALHRPQIALDPGFQSVARNLQQLSQEKVTDAATEITVIAKSLQDRDLTRFLPPAGVTVLLPAAIQHIKDLKSTNSTIREVGFRRLYQILQVLHQLQESYHSADYALLLIEAVIRKANIELPEEKEQRRAHFVAGSKNGPSTSIAKVQSESHQSGGTSPVAANLSAAPFSFRLEADNMEIPIGTTAAAEEEEEGQLTNVSVAKTIPATSTELDFDSLINFDVFPEICLAESDGHGLELDCLNWAMDLIADHAFTDADS